MNVISSMKYLKYFLSFVSILIFTGFFFQGHFIADSGQFLVVFHTHHDIVLYCQSCGLSNHRENGSSYQFRRGLGQAIQDQIRMFTIRIYKRVLQGKPSWHIHRKILSLQKAIPNLPGVPTSSGQEFRKKKNLKLSQITKYEKIVKGCLHSD